jgi:hypothetical protein
MEGEYTMPEMPEMPQITGGRSRRKSMKRNTKMRKNKMRKSMKRVKGRYGGTYFGMNKGKGTLSAKGTPHSKSKFGLNL